MIYQLDIAEVAKRDRDDAYEFYKENYSKQFADKWYLGIAAAIRSLKENPERKGLVHENASLSVECRQYIYHTPSNIVTELSLRLQRRLSTCLEFAIPPRRIYNNPICRNEMASCNYSQARLA